MITTYLNVRASSLSVISTVSRYPSLLYLYFINWVWGSSGFFCLHTVSYSLSFSFLLFFFHSFTLVSKKKVTKKIKKLKNQKTNKNKCLNSTVLQFNLVGILAFSPHGLSSHKKKWIIEISGERVLTVNPIDYRQQSFNRKL